MISRVKEREKRGGAVQITRDAQTAVQVNEPLSPFGEGIHQRQAGRREDQKTDDN